MSPRRVLLSFATVVVFLFTGRSAFAQWAVIDVGAIAQLIEQYKTLQEQLTTARDHLQQARDQYDALTGDRGMQHLMSDVGRNYLPGDWQALTQALAGASGAFPAFTQRAHEYLDANAVLKAEEIARYSSFDQKHLDDLRHSVASLQALAQQALGANSERFEGLQTLIDAIAAARDPKAILDLQARIQAEQTMVSNDANKLQSLFQAVKAEEDAQRLRRREQATRDIGSFKNLPPLGL